MNVLSIGEKIKRKRKMLGMTLKDLAGNRVTTGQISLIESGKSNPSMDLLEYLAKKLKTSIEYLLESEEKQAIKICNYYENIAFCHLYDKNVNKVKHYLTKMLDIVNKYNLEEVKYKVYFIKGCCSYEMENYEEAVESILTANIGFSKFSMYEEFIKSLLYLSYISIKQKNFISAIIHLKCIVKLKDKYFHNYDLMFFEVYYLISKSYAEIGYIDDSQYYLKEAIHLLNKFYNPRENALLFMEHSIRAMEEEDLDNAIRFSFISREYFEKLDKLNLRQVVEINISKDLIENNQLDIGKRYLLRAKGIVENYRFDNLSKIYKNFIILYIKKKDLDRANKYLLKFEKILDMTNFDDVKDFYILKYEIKILNEDYSEAEIVLILAYNFFKEFKEFDIAGYFCLILSKFYIDMKRIDEAKNIISEAFLQYKKVGYKGVL